MTQVRVCSMPNCQTTAGCKCGSGWPSLPAAASEFTPERAIWALLAALLETGRSPEDITAALRSVHDKIFQPSTAPTIRCEART